MKNYKNYIYSEYCGIIPRGFVLKYSKSDEVIIGKEHFTWNESECMYMSDDVDGKGYFLEDIFTPFIRCSTGSRVDFLLD